MPVLPVPGSDPLNPLLGGTGANVGSNRGEWGGSVDHLFSRVAELERQHDSLVNDLENGDYYRDVRAKAQPYMYQGPFACNVQANGSTIKVQPGYIYAGVLAKDYWPSTYGQTDTISAGTNPSIIYMRVQVDPILGTFTGAVNSFLGSTNDYTTLNPDGYCDFILGVATFIGGTVLRWHQHNDGTDLYCPVCIYDESGVGTRYKCSWENYGDTVD